MVSQDLVNKATGFTLSEIRKWAKLSQEELSQRLGISIDELEDHEKGNISAEISFILNHAEACNTIPEDTFNQIIGEVRKRSER
ncbi:MAG: helix-turn-helix transcriptional regulator [Tissierellia bacterium]|nr:helix-turn-helix transcriptional regulator [Tissierellia bacterium]